MQEQLRTVKNIKKQFTRMNGIPWMEISYGDKILGILEFELFNNEAPRTCLNFYSLCNGQNSRGLAYEGSPFHRLIPGFMVQGGDVTKGDGTGGKSIFKDDMFDDEDYLHIGKHNKRGLLSMANHGPNTNASQFFILFAPAKHLDGKHVVFGRVSKGIEILDEIEQIPTDPSDKPKRKLVVTKSGVIQEMNESKTVNEKLEAAVDKQHKVRAREMDALENRLEVSSFPVPTMENQEAVFVDPEQQALLLSKQGQNFKDGVAMENMNPRKRKLLELQRLKASAKQENQKQVIEEHRGLNSSKSAHKIFQETMEKVRTEKESHLEKLGIDKDKMYLLETAESAMKKKLKADLKSENVAASTAYHPANDDFAFRSYANNIRKITQDPSDSVVTPATSFGESADTENAKDKLASAIANKNKHIIQRNRNGKRATLEGETVSGINSRNEQYNKMLAKSFDKYTTEIRENLERGTAL